MSWVAERKVKASSTPQSGTVGCAASNHGIARQSAASPTWQAAIQPCREPTRSANGAQAGFRV